MIENYQNIIEEELNKINKIVTWEGIETSAEKIIGTYEQKINKDRFGKQYRAKIAEKIETRRKSLKRAHRTTQKITKRKRKKT